MDQKRIDAYVDGGPQLVRAYQGLDQKDLLAFPVPGTWSLQQIAVHLLDSDLILSDRMKRIASMDRPLLCAFDETAFNQLPGIDQFDAHEVCAMFEKNRQWTGMILRGLPDEAFQRAGIHTEVGRVTLEEMVGKAIAHLENHLVFVQRKRQMLGK